MVGRVRVRGQGPVRRGQTTTTFKKGGRVKSRPSKGLRPKYPRLSKEWFDKSVESFKDVKDAVSKKNVHQKPRSKQSAKFRHMLDNPKRIPKASPHADRSERLSPGLHKLKKGGRVKLMHGGRPSARTRHIENEKEEIRRVDRNIRRNEGYKTGGRVKKATGGIAAKKKPSGRESYKGLRPGKSPTGRKSRVMTADTDFHKRKRAAEKDKGKPNTPGEKMRTMQGMYSAGQARNKKTFRGDFDVGKQLRKKRKHHS